MKYKVCFYILIVIFCIIMNNYFILFVVSGSSMSPTYEDGQKVICYRNDFSQRKILKDKCIIFKLYNDSLIYVKDDLQELDIKNKFSDLYIKRIVGVCGDKVDIIDNKLYINNIFLCNCVLTVPNKSYVVGKDEFFVLGDNHKDSMDSRYFGTINKNNIIYVVY